MDDLDHSCSKSQILDYSTTIVTRLDEIGSIGPVIYFGYDDDSGFANVYY